jgi:E3 ubiquitin-protein ligase RNF13/E3 ubiquitin-protein ligase RNF167
MALVQRGECHFVDKVREAQRLGAKAVVVGGDDPEISGNPDTLVNMFSPGTYGFILAPPKVFV